MWWRGFDSRHLQKSDIIKQTIKWTSSCCKTLNQLTHNLLWKVDMRILFLLLTMGLLQTGCTPVEPVMSKAGVMTHPDCAKYSTEEAVATCESGLRQRGGSPRFSFGVGVTRLIDWPSLCLLCTWVEYQNRACWCLNESRETAHYIAVGKWQ